MRLEAGYSDKVIDVFLKGALDQVEWQRRCGIVMDSVTAIIDGTWGQLYKHRDEMSVPGAVIMKVSSDFWLVWRVNVEIPGVVQLLRFEPV